MFNFTSNTSCWTNPCESIFMSEQNSLNPYKPSLINTAHDIPNLEQHYSVPETHHDQTTTLFSFAHLPFSDDPLFDGQRHQDNQHSQIHQHDHNGLTTNQSQLALSTKQATGKSIADCSPKIMENNPSSDNHDRPQLISTSGIDNNKSDKKKRDRHSKIITSNRPRHRRMRLSIDVAHQFFNLQEKLGFDRASKTVAWLLVHARSEIEKLEREMTGSSSTNSDCEVISSLDQEGTVSGDQGQEGGTSSKPCNKEKKKQRGSCSQRVFKLISKKARDMARRRARERTRVKLVESGRITTRTNTLDASNNIIQDHDDHHTAVMITHSQVDHLRFNGWMEDGYGARSQNLIDPIYLETGSAIQQQDQCYRHELAAQENDHDNLALIPAFLNSEKCNQSLPCNSSQVNSSTIGFGILQQEQCSDRQLLNVKAWNQVYMNSHNM